MLALAASLLVLSVPVPEILVFSKTAGYRHDSIETGRAAIRKIADEREWNATATEDPEVFQPRRLKDFKCVVFLSTTGDVLNAQQEAAFQEYIEAGGGFVGIHAAADTEYEWPFYGKVVGAYFKSHPAIQKATLIIEDAKHPTTAFLPEKWVRTDEWYCYRRNPRGTVKVLASLDESTYLNGTMGKDHPIAWCQEVEKGRSWYTGGGHTKEAYSEPLFIRHIAEGIAWAGRIPQAPGGGW